VYKIKRTVLFLIPLCLISCANQAILEYFKEPETGKITFKAGHIDQAAPLNLNQLQDVTIGFLPVRSSMGGGLGEEMVTKYIYDNIAAMFLNIKFISSSQASDLFSDMDLWEDYFAYLDRYHQSSVAKTNFDELKELYQKLGASYIININSDYTPINKYPGVFETNIQIQIWDINSGKKVWEGFCLGQDIVYSADTFDAVKQKMVDWACNRIAEEMAGVTTTEQPTNNPNNL
jgi:hypothetical protein